MDLRLLPPSLVQSIKTLGGVKLATFMDVAMSHMSHFEAFFGSKVGTSFRRLTYFADKEDKTRVVAIGDYFSQTALRRFHLYLFRVLKKIPQDVTFDQGRFKELIQGWEIFYSVDLSSATDRFPIQFISSVLRRHFPSSYVDAWEDVMVGYPFGVPGKDDKISYSVGNPMGFYSSWASFAVAHHYIFYQISVELNIPFKDMKYVVLGDDVLIGDHRVGVRYMEFIRSLGVEVSELKTHISSTTLEFAKR